MHLQNMMRIEYKTGINITEQKIAQIINSTIKDQDGLLYDLLTFCIMPNHVHVLFVTGTTLYTRHLGEIMKIIKGSSSRKTNQLLHQTGTFWQKASYDRLV